MGGWVGVSPPPPWGGGWDICRSVGMPKFWVGGSLNYPPPPLGWLSKTLDMIPYLNAQLRYSATVPIFHASISFFGLGLMFGDGDADSSVLWVVVILLLSPVHFLVFRASLFVLSLQ